MVSTYKLMSQVLVDEYKGLSNEELAKQYQVEENPSILAEVFCRNFKLLCGLAFKPQFKFYLDKDIIASDTVISLDKALRTFDINGDYKFMTYAGRVITLQLQWQLNRLNHKGRNEQVFSIDEFTQDTDDELFEDNFVKEDNFDIDLVNLYYDIDNSNLKDVEKQVCKIILTNPRITEREIGEKLNISRMSVHILKVKLREKLSKVLCY